MWRFTQRLPPDTPSAGGCRSRATMSIHLAKSDGEVASAPLEVCSSLGSILSFGDPAGSPGHALRDARLVEAKPAAQKSAWDSWNLLNRTSHLPFRA